MYITINIIVFLCTFSAHNYNNYLFLIVNQSQRNAYGVQYCGCFNIPQSLCMAGYISYCDNIDSNNIYYICGYLHVMFA